MEREGCCIVPVYPVLQGSSGLVPRSVVALQACWGLLGSWGQVSRAGGALPVYRVQPGSLGLASWVKVRHLHRLASLLVQAWSSVVGCRRCCSCSLGT